MCGIIAYTGEHHSARTVFGGLCALEYRGYDSWGIASRDGNGIHTRKAVGRISSVDPAILDTLLGNTAIGHTRWATHGGVSEKNAHPHWNRDQSIAVVHNGIIENHQELRKLAARLLHTTERALFASDTDTEVVPHLIEAGLRAGRSFEEAFRFALRRLHGQFAIVAFSTHHPGLFGARDGSPLIVGFGKNGMLLASDTQALAGSTSTVHVLRDREYVVLTPGRCVVKTLSGGRSVQIHKERIPALVKDPGKGRYLHYMLKEIMEEKDAVKNAARQNYGTLRRAAGLMRGKKVVFIGCGTAGRMAALAQYHFASIAKRDTIAVVGSEFGLVEHGIDRNTVIVPISQSGETADVIDALKRGKKKGAKVLAILNARGSGIERMANMSLFISAGPERAVASTKAAVGQMTILALLAYASAGDTLKGQTILKKDGHRLSRLSFNALSHQMKHVAKLFRKDEHCYIIGRGVHAPIAEEAAIKIQEVSYLHAEGFAGGELKHGPLALVTKDTKCIAFLPDDETKRDMEGNISELKARGAWVLGIAPSSHPLLDVWIKVSDLTALAPVASIIPIQLLAYHLGHLKGNDPDKPRNLAKSVTVK